MMNFTIVLFFIAPILLTMVSLLSMSMERKKQKLEFEALRNNMQLQSNLFYERAQLAGTILDEAGDLTLELKKEHNKMRDTNRFLHKAIKEKVNKKKIRGKRRRKTA